MLASWPRPGDLYRCEGEVLEFFVAGRWLLVRYMPVMGRGKSSFLSTPSTVETPQQKAFCVPISNYDIMRLTVSDEFTYQTFIQIC